MLVDTMTPILLDLVVEPLPTSSQTLQPSPGGSPAQQSATPLLWVTVVAAILIAAAILVLTKLIRRRRS